MITIDERETARQRLAHMLAQLIPDDDPTPEGVARVLRAMGVRGYRGDCAACPIAVAITRSFPPDVHAPADDNTPRPGPLPAVFAEYVKAWVDGMWVEVPLEGALAPIGVFIRAFDHRFPRSARGPAPWPELSLDPPGVTP